MHISPQFIEKLNNDISQFPQVCKIKPDFHIRREGVSRLVMLDRYAFKDIEKKTISLGDYVIVTLREDPKFPAQGLGRILKIDRDNNKVEIILDNDYKEVKELTDEEVEQGYIVRSINMIEKPLEIFWEQIARRVADTLASIESLYHRVAYAEKFYQLLMNDNHIPAGRVLYGAGTGTNVTFFNCFVLPFIHDSRGGISQHRGKVFEIMSRGGGCGSNGSTLRPRFALARDVGGKSSGAVSHLNDLSKLTDLTQQGGSRRGAQMEMLADWHADVIEFIISKMQNPKILQFIIQSTNDPLIKQMAKEKLIFTPLSDYDRTVLEGFTEDWEEHCKDRNHPHYLESMKKLKDGGIYSVNDPEFLSGANISVTITDDFMNAVFNDLDWNLRFPDVENYTKEEMEFYNNEWHKCGDVRKWEAIGMKVKTYHTMKARELWILINICATYAAEPGIFFIDNANKMTNATAYGQMVVATNPCGEQPLPGDAVCNLGAVVLSSIVKNKKIDWHQFKNNIHTAVRMQDNVIDITPYFLPENRKQALSERRIGLGVMELHDMLLKLELKYGSPEANNTVNEVFRFLAIEAYRASIEIAKEKGSFPFLVGENEEETMQLRLKFINTGYMKGMPEDIRQDVLKYGIRNSHLLTVAPTGTTGTMVGGSTGLEPYYGYEFFRSGRLGKFIPVRSKALNQYFEQYPEKEKEYRIHKQAALPSYFVTAMDLTPEQHVTTQCIIQRWIDSSISKTVNAPKGYSVEQVKNVYELLYRGGAKGGTVYVDGSRNAQVLSLTADEHEEFVDVNIEGGDAPQKESTTVYGVEVGDTCPICREGTVIESGGCTTCSHCKSQLKCGL